MTVQGHRMLLAPRNRYPSPDMVANRYEEHTARLFQELLKPGMVVVDVGAHVGIFTLLAAREVGPNGMVYAFEPEPENHNLLLKNIQFNGYSNIVATQKAVTNKLARIDLFLSALDTGSNSIYSKAARGVTGTLKVDATTLDSFLEEVGWPQAALIKIDVEGAELAVLEGMRQLLENQQALNLIIEYCPSLLRHAGSEPSDLLDKLATLGFEINIIDEKREMRPLNAADSVHLTAGLLKQETYCNLYCTR